MFTILSALGVAVLSTPVYAEAPKIALEANYYIETVFSETLEEMSDRISGEYNISKSTLRNLVWSESRWKPDADNGEDRGLVQINREHNPTITDEQAFDEEFALNFAAEKIAKGEEYLWTACNCYSLVKTKVQGLPKMKDIKPNTFEPVVGSVAVFDYDGLKHVAYVTEVHADSFKVFEANYQKCLISSRTVDKNDRSLQGFMVKL